MEKVIVRTYPPSFPCRDIGPSFITPVFAKPCGGTEASFLSLNGDISPWSEERRPPLKRLGTRFGQDSVDGEGRQG